MIGNEHFLSINIISQISKMYEHHKDIITAVKGSHIILVFGYVHFMSPTIHEKCHGIFKSIKIHSYIFCQCFIILSLVPVILNDSCGYSFDYQKRTIQGIMLWLQFLACSLLKLIIRVGRYYVRNIISVIPLLDPVIITSIFMTFVFNLFFRKTCVFHKLHWGYD